MSVGMDEAYAQFKAPHTMVQCHYCRCLMDGACKGQGATHHDAVPLLVLFYGHWQSMHSPKHHTPEYSSMIQGH
eukprot:1161156-Pelagomonas_calceolata.AAC.3